MWNEWRDADERIHTASCVSFNVDSRHAWLASLPLSAGVSQSRRACNVRFRVQMVEDHR
jgi:hypothetical protein